MENTLVYVWLISTTIINLLFCFSVVGEIIKRVGCNRYFASYKYVLDNDESGFGAVKFSQNGLFSGMALDILEKRLLETYRFKKVIILSVTKLEGNV